MWKATKIWLYWQIVHVQTRNICRKYAPQNFLGLWDKNGSPNPDQKKKQTSLLIDFFAVPVWLQS